MNKNEITGWLKAGEIDALFEEACRIKNENSGNKVFIRAIIEFSNKCARNCAYCGLNHDNKSLIRYTMLDEHVVKVTQKIKKAGVKTIVLQSGEDLNYSRKRICGLIEKIKKYHNKTAITLSLGERLVDDYKAFRSAGADRYLLKIETSNPRLYKKLHPGQELKQRIKALDTLRKTGYQVGTGNIVGLPGQTLGDLAEDILFFKKFQPDMISVGPFIPQKDTLLKNISPGRGDLALKVLALTRIVTKNAFLPATTAFLTITPKEKWFHIFTAGADVIMLDYTPEHYRQNYKIYDNKKTVTFQDAVDVIKDANKVMSLKRADSLRVGQA
ncbi:MAG: [FeFe] hydrogenase H-cluster radical SAM maturase HydE [Candidatus Omnitrophota bacterium]|nr:[FeFe] hydrogenase H-cluster radical SAM maturase HydE [Candidatus Omnitrophota bacterium]MBU1894869.1 [FeFe] hydrogenase H-cluster radical SAM maturase HydE [Candidatus Omnitrophota bacterium]